MARTDIQARLGLDTTAFQRGMARANKGVKSFARSSMASFAAIAGAAGIGSLVSSAINLGSKISDLATQLNIGAQELQALQYAAQKAGVSTSILERALRNVQLRTQEALDGNKRYSEALARLGINAEEFIKLPTDQKMVQIAQAQMQASDSAQAYRDAAVILGERAGPALQEVLQSLAGPDGFAGLTQAAQDAGQVMSDETIAKMDEAADNLERFKTQLTILVSEITAVAMPVLNGLAGAMESIGEGLAKLIYTGGKSIDEFDAQMQLRSEGAFEGIKGRGGAQKIEAMIKKRAELIRKQREEEKAAAKEKHDADQKEIQQGREKIKLAHKLNQIKSKPTAAMAPTAASGKMGLDIERGEFESRRAFLARRESARAAHIKLMEAKRQISAGSERFDPAALQSLKLQAMGATDAGHQAKMEKMTGDIKQSLKVIEREMAG